MITVLIGNDIIMFARRRNTRIIGQGFPVLYHTELKSLKRETR